MGFAHPLVRLDSLPSLTPSFLQFHRLLFLISLPFAICGSLLKQLSLAFCFSFCLSSVVARSFFTLVQRHCSLPLCLNGGTCLEIDNSNNNENNHKETSHRVPVSSPILCFCFCLFLPLFFISHFSAASLLSSSMPQWWHVP